MSSRKAIIADAAVGDASKKKTTKKKKKNNHHHDDHGRHRKNRCSNNNDDDDNKHDGHIVEAGRKALKCLVRGCPKLICPECFDDILENDLDIDLAFQRHSDNNNNDDDVDDDAIISEDDNQNGDDDDAPPPPDVEKGQRGAARRSRRDDDKDPKQPKKRKALVGTSEKENFVGGVPSSSSGPAGKRRRSSSPVHPTISRTDSISSLSGNSAFDESSRSSSNQRPRSTAEEIIKYMMQMFRDHEERKASAIRRLEREKELADAQRHLAQTERIARIKAAHAEFDYTRHLHKMYDQVKEMYADQGYDYIAQIFPQLIVFFPDEELSEDQKERFAKAYNEWNKAHGLHRRIEYPTQEESNL